MDYPIKTLAQLRPILRGFRKNQKLTQKAFAAQLGITQQTYAELEANPTSVTVGRLFPILRLLGVELILRNRELPVAEETTAGVEKRVRAQGDTVGNATSAKKKEVW